MSQLTNEVRDTLNQFLSAVMSQNLARIMAFFNDDAQMFSPLGTFPARLDGRGAIDKQFAVILEAFKVRPVGSEHEAGAAGPRCARARSQCRPDSRFTCGCPVRCIVDRFVMTQGAIGWRIAHIHASIASPT